MKEKLQSLELYRKYPCIRKCDGKKWRFAMEDPDTVFVFLKGARRRGHRYTIQGFLEKFSVRNKDIEKKDPTPLWRKHLKRAVKCMEASGLWPEIKEVYDNMLASGMTWQDREKLSEINDYLHGWYKPDIPVADYEKQVAEYKAHFPFAFYETEDGTRNIHSDYCNELSCCELKSMYFGKYSTEKRYIIQKALAEKQSYHSGRIVVGYDVSYEYNAVENKAIYSEEYRNCGNGHYYLALDENTAVFCEHD